MNRYIMVTVLFVLLIWRDPTDRLQAQSLLSWHPSAITLSVDTLTISEVTQLNAMLGSSLRTLSDDERRGRRVGGYVLLGLGAGSLVGGATTLILAENDDARIVGYSLMGGGLIMGGLSLLPLNLTGPLERTYAEFRKTAAETPSQARQKYIYWDHRFEEMARKSRQERIIGGITTIVAAGVTSLVWLDEDRTAQLHTFVWPAIGGVSSLFIKSDVERSYDTYRRAKRDILGTSVAIRSIEYAWVPLPQRGMIATLRIRF
jgi:MFS family permease